MTKIRSWLGAIALFATVTHSASAAEVGNIDCGDAEYFKPFGFIENSGGDPNGTNVGIIADGYFIVIFAPDSGNPPGEIGVYDISNPKKPVERKHLDNGDTQRFREAHSLPVAIVGDKEYVAIQTIDGIQIWDITDPVSMSRVAKLDLEGIAGGDYDNVAWQATWQGRYLYVAGSNQGIYIIDTIDPKAPKLLEKVSNNKTGGFRVGPLYAMGDYLIVSNMDTEVTAAVLDISDPTAPALLGRGDSFPNVYTTYAFADRIYGSGRNGSVTIHSFSDPTEIIPVKSISIGGDSLYVIRQDDAIFSGNQDEFVKIDVTDERAPKVIDKGTLGRDHPDHGQVTPLGNLVYVGNDHGSGSAFFCHQRGKDTTPPAVQRIYPADGALGVPVSSRITIAFSDYIDTRTINNSNVSVRPVGGDALDGIYTFTFNTLSFGAREPLSANQTYEIVLEQNGIKDVMGNGLATRTVARFSTGETIDTTPEPDPDPDPNPSTGGAPSASGGTTGSDHSSGSSNVSPGGNAQNDPDGPKGSGGERNASTDDDSAGASSCECGIGSTPRGSGFTPLLLGLLLLASRRLRGKN